ncbi:MFS transporter [Hymenobacter pini]|uniref:MFS transporter n=1 Tax=Hymenobacter pini TaxID=2880879 RepID=UPI001CF49F56|nr:MFS transporter [Hymenobacter pini]MCA8832996.1 MFS transporter [Hymenobacter pini]
MATSVAAAPTGTRRKPRLSFWQIWNMSFGFMGIQFGFALQNANTSRIFSNLGANADDIPILWVAAPLTGLLVQPIIGYMSDRTWSPRWGRRRPFFLIGAILASLAMLIMPNSPSLMIAGGMLWIMDASINISMEPFRAFVGDKLPGEQHTTGFAMQSFFIGVGAVVASLLPTLLTGMGVANEAPAGIVPNSVKYAYYLGAAAFFLCVLYTVLTSNEYPPEDMEAFEREKKSVTLAQGVKETFTGVLHMPKVMKQLASVQFFTWFGLFCMWIFMTLAVAKHVYHTTDTTSRTFNEAGNFVGNAFAMYNGVSAAFSLLLPLIARKVSRRLTHMLCLTAGGLGLISVAFITEPWMLYISMVGVGVAWTSILSVPYAMLAGAIPSHKMGHYMGVFNAFIVTPQVCASLGLPAIMKAFPSLDPLNVVVLGGALMIIGGLLTLRVSDDEQIHLPLEEDVQPLNAAYDAGAQPNPAL